MINRITVMKNYIWFILRKVLKGQRLFFMIDIYFYNIVSDYLNRAEGHIYVWLELLTENC
jgi:hypothetical protein